MVADKTYSQAEPNSVLDRARQLYRERTNELHQYVEGLNKTFQGLCAIEEPTSLFSSNRSQST